MMTAGSTRSAATKRLMKEYAELQSSPNYQYTAAPLEDNLFDWHFTIRGPEDSEFENGIYHGRIVLPPQYPYKPPSIYFLTPNGRFELGKKICLSITGYHPETWLPAWGIRTALIALISFMTTDGKDAIGALNYTPEERRILAKKSHSWHCQQCGCKNCEQLLPIPKKEHREETKNDDDSKLAEMLVVSHDKKNSETINNEQTTIDDVNNKTTTTTNIPTPDNNNNNNVINQAQPVINTNPVNIQPTTNNINTFNTNTVELNTSTIQQRIPTTNETETIKQPQVQPQPQPQPQIQPPTTSNNTTPSVSPSSSQTNLNNRNKSLYIFINDDIQKDKNNNISGINTQIEEMPMNIAELI